MNKKIILPLTVAILGLTSCNKNNNTVLNNETAAKETYNALINSARNLKNISLSTSLNSSKSNFEYVHRSNAKYGYDNIGERYRYNLTDTKATLNATLGGLNSYEKSKSSIGEIYSNPLIKGKIELKDVSSKGLFTYVAVHKDPSKYPYFEGKTIIDNSISTLPFYINHNVEEKVEGLKYYGIYADLRNASDTLIKLSDSTLLNEAYKKHGEAGKTTLKSRLYKLGTQTKEGGEYDTIYYSLKSLPISILPEQTLEILLGNVSKAIRDFGDVKQTEAEKTEYINKIKTAFDTLSNSKVSTDVVKFEKTDILKTTINLNYENLNKLINKEIFKSGTVAVTIETNNSLQFSKFSINTTDLSSKEFAITSTIISGEESGKYIQLNDVSCSLDTTITYGVSSDDVNTAVSPTESSTINWKLKSFTK